MRFVGLILFSAFTLTAQVELVDPEYVIPQHNPHTSPGDLKRGEQLFRGQCAGCHGPKGEGGKGAFLAQPRLRRAPDDQSLFLVIRDGVKGTEMPPAPTLTSREIWQLAGYVRSLGRLPAESVPGDPARGRELYRTKGNCAQCHIIGGQGGSLGPELTEIGSRRNASRLRAVLMEPEANIVEDFLLVRLATSDGRQIAGVRLNEDTFTIQVRDLNGGIHSFVKQELKELQRDPGKTPMPSLRGAFSPAETDDLIAYLVSLKGTP